MDPRYRLADPAGVFSPALLFYRDRIRDNLRRMVEIAGGPGRLRPHVKTHKTREIVRLQLAAGVTKHKCATVAEAELLAGCGVPDVLIAYPLVGPNCARLARLAALYPATRFSVLADHPRCLEALSAALAAAGRTVDVVLDLDIGQHRTGIAPGPEAAALYARLAELPGLRPGGLHAYDGHNHQPSLSERQAAVAQALAPVLELRDALKRQGLPVPRIVQGGTPTFGVHAAAHLPEGECSPGTCVLSDHNYGTRFPELGFVPAALLLTRVVSRPTAERVTFDLGYKAVASDPPAGSRCFFWDVPDARVVLQNEEHCVVETPAAGKFAPGDVAYAQPAHVCPTCALHRFAYVVEAGNVVEQWEIVGRDRILTV